MLLVRWPHRTGPFGLPCVGAWCWADRSARVCVADTVARRRRDLGSRSPRGVQDEAPGTRRASRAADSPEYWSGSTASANTSPPLADWAIAWLLLSWLLGRGGRASRCRRGGKGGLGGGWTTCVRVRHTRRASRVARLPPERCGHAYRESAGFETAPLALDARPCPRAHRGRGRPCSAPASPIPRTTGRAQRLAAVARRGASLPARGTPFKSTDQAVPLRGRVGTHFGRPPCACCAPPRPSLRAERRTRVLSERPVPCQPGCSGARTPARPTPAVPVQDSFSGARCLCPLQARDTGGLRSLPTLWLTCVIETLVPAGHASGDALCRACLSGFRICSGHACTRVEAHIPTSPSLCPLSLVPLSLCPSVPVPLSPVARPPVPWQPSSLVSRPPFVRAPRPGWVYAVTLVR